MVVSETKGKEKEKINPKITQKKFGKIFESLRFFKNVTDITILLAYIIGMC